MQAQMQTPIVENEGYVKSMNLPPGWIEQSEPRPAWAGPYWRIFRPSPDAKARLSFFDRGRPLTDNAAQDMHKLLMNAPAVLTTEDLQTIREVIRDAALVDEFKFRNARSHVLNGRRVIIIEGQWNELQEECLWVIASEPQSAWVYEIVYQAPENEYSRYFETIRSCLMSVEWTA